MWILGRGGKRPQDSRYSFTTCSFTLNLLLPKGHGHMKRLRGSLQTGLKGVTLPPESCLVSPAPRQQQQSKAGEPKNGTCFLKKCSFSLPFRSTFCQRPAFAATGFTNVNLSCQAPVERLFSPPIRLKISVDYIINPSCIKKKEVRQQEDQGRKKKRPRNSLNNGSAWRLPAVSLSKVDGSLRLKEGPQKCTQGFSHQHCFTLLLKSFLERIPLKHHREQRLATGWW